MTKGPRKKRTALAQVGGAVKSVGDPTVLAWLERAADVTGGDARTLTHGFHAWPARMHPLTARRAIKQAAPGWIVDPFMGGGTVPLEAMLAGRSALGRDLNPVAIEVAWARSRRWDKPRRNGLVEAASEVVQHAKKERPKDKRVPKAFFDAEGAWYDPPALVDLWCLLQQLDKRRDDPQTRMLRVVLSSVVVKASRQASDSITRIDRDHRFVPKYRLFDWFVARAEEHANNLKALFKAIADGAEGPQFKVSDGRAALALEPGSVGMICSSPPYPGTYDYVDHHRRRYPIFGIDAGEATKKELGSRREQRKLGHEEAARRYAQDMAAAFKAWRPALHAEAKIVLVVGDGQYKGGGVVKVVPLIKEAAEKAGLRLTGRVAQRRDMRGHTGRSRGAPRGRKRTHKAEFLLCLELNP